jgi:hypothetical protein
VILPEVFLVKRDTISKYVLWTVAPETDMPLEMMSIAILRAICKTCCWNLFAMPEDAICTGNVILPALGVGILFDSEILE